MAPAGPFGERCSGVQRCLTASRDHLEAGQMVGPAEPLERDPANMVSETVAAGGFNGI